jgi:acetoin utilization deacetylase AcuC-like enzyme
MPPTTPQAARSWRWTGSCTAKCGNAFVACRPPGHHATRDKAMGFCIFNNVAVAAAHALAAHGLARWPSSISTCITATVPRTFSRTTPASCCVPPFQHPFYPFSGAESSNEHIVNVPLPAGTTGKRYREVFEAEVLPRLEAFQPEMVFISAGFDAHREDDMGQFGLMESDYIWITERIMEVARRHAKDRVVSVLEGGYDLSSLGRSVAAHMKVLADL